MVRTEQDAGRLVVQDDVRERVAGTFASREAAEAWTPPDWLGVEVTGDAAYANQAVAR